MRIVANLSEEEANWILALPKRKRPEVLRRLLDEAPSETLSEPTPAQTAYKYAAVMPPPYSERLIALAEERGWAPGLALKALIHAAMRGALTVDPRARRSVRPVWFLDSRKRFLLIDCGKSSMPVLAVAQSIEAVEALTAATPGVDKVSVERAKKYLRQGFPRRTAKDEEEV